MNGVGVRWQFEDGALRQYLDHLGREDFQAVRVDIGEYMVGQIQDRFDQQMLWDGSAMSQSRAAIARSGQTLMENRILYKSYTYQLVRNGLALGSAMAYARIHHFSGMTGRGHKTKIEARPVLGVNDRDQAVIGQMLLNSLKGN